MSQIFWQAGPVVLAGTRRRLEKLEEHGRMLHNSNFEFIMTSFLYSRAP